MARWHSCNILQIASDANRLWQFDAKGGGFVLGREHRGKLEELLPSRLVAKSWSSLWQPRLNVAWLPPENVFLRVIELPKSNLEETLAMVELQLEKLSPMPLAQVVWTLHVLAHRGDPARGSERDAREETPGEPKAEELQTVVVVIAARTQVEEYLGKLEGRGYLADRLDVPMLDQLESTPATEDGAWIYPMVLAGQSTLLVAWWCGGILRNLSYVVLPPDADRVKHLKAQLAQLTWAGEMEGWLTTLAIKWHLVADPVSAVDWESALHDALAEPVHVVPPLAPGELAGHTARRAALAGTTTTLLPGEFPARYHQQFVDRLWLRGLVAVGVFYAICVAVYGCATAVLAYRTHAVERQVAALSGSYTNTLQLQARYNVLKERQELKFAALDCWKILAENLPAGIALQRFSFADGQKLSLSGTTTPDQVDALITFNSQLQKARLNDHPVFAAEGGDPLVYRQANKVVSWSFSLQLRHTEESR